MGHAHIRILFRYWWLLFSLPLAGGIVAYGYSISQDPLYDATATLLIQQRRAEFAPGVSRSEGAIPASRRQCSIASFGKPAQYLTLRKRSSSTAAINSPSRIIQADAPP